MPLPQTPAPVLGDFSLIPTAPSHKVRRSHSPSVLVESSSRCSLPFLARLTSLLFLVRDQELPHLSFTICSSLSAQDVFMPLLNHYAPAWLCFEGRTVTRNIERTEGQARSPGVARPCRGAQGRYNRLREGLLKREGMSILPWEYVSWARGPWACCREEWSSS